VNKWTIFKNQANCYLEQFEQDVREMSWNVRKSQVWRANQLNWWSAEHVVMLFANKPSVLDRFVYDVVNVGTCTAIMDNKSSFDRVELMDAPDDPNPVRVLRM
jgi:hypothetical protein